MKLTKRITSAALAGTMALSLATTAFAASTTPANTTKITGAYEAVTLAVTVPTTGSVKINPYGLPVELDAETVISGQQIVTAAPLVISNQSKVALSVKANGKATVKGAATLSTTAVTDAETGNKIEVNFEAFKAPGVLDDTEQADLNAMFAALDSDDAVIKGNLTATAADIAPTSTLILRAGDEDGATQDGGAAFFRLAGSAAKKPTTAWVAADGFDAEIVFTFEPAEYVGAVTLEAAGGATTVDESGTLAVTVNLPAGVRAVANTVKWTSSKEANVTVTPGTGSTTQLAATLNGVSASASVTAKISVEFVGNDGVTYRSNELSIKCV